MKLPIHIGKKLQQLLQPEESIAASEMKHVAVIKMLEDGVLQKRQLSKTKALLFILNKEAMAAYLHNHFGINDLAKYINIQESEEQSRSNNVVISGNSKLQTVRTFKGFLVNTYEPAKTILNGKPFHIHPAPGSYTFIHDYENFIPGSDLTIVGIENPENFRQIEKQRYLFQNMQPLFVSRYPQSNDLIRWLAAISNKYLHFGDLDFAGIQIYQTEFKKQLGNRASFFIPENAAALLQRYGNKELFNRQYSPFSNFSMTTESSIQELLQLILQHKKVLEQEVFILP